MYARSARGASTATHGVWLRRSLEVVGALLATLLIFSASANAFSQRGHVPVSGPSGSFDEGGHGGRRGSTAVKAVGDRGQRSHDRRRRRRRVCAGKREQPSHALRAGAGTQIHRSLG